jgi:hypothetical protein
VTAQLLRQPDGFEGFFPAAERRTISTFSSDIAHAVSRSTLRAVTARAATFPGYRKPIGAGSQFDPQVVVALEDVVR